MNAYSSSLKIIRIEATVIVQEFYKKKVEALNGIPLGLFIFSDNNPYVDRNSHLIERIKEVEKSKESEINVLDTDQNVDIGSKNSILTSNPITPPPLEPEYTIEIESEIINQVYFSSSSDNRVNTQLSKYRASPPETVLFLRSSGNSSLFKSTFSTSS